MNAAVRGEVSGEVRIDRYLFVATAGEPYNVTALQDLDVCADGLERQVRVSIFAPAGTLVLEDWLSRCGPAPQWRPTGDQPAMVVVEDLRPVDDVGAPVPYLLTVH